MMTKGRRKHNWVLVKNEMAVNIPNAIHFQTHCVLEYMVERIHSKRKTARDSVIPLKLPKKMAGSAAKKMMVRAATMRFVNLYATKNRRGMLRRNQNPDWNTLAPIGSS